MDGHSNGAGVALANTTRLGKGGRKGGIYNEPQCSSVWGHCYCSVLYLSHIHANLSMGGVFVKERSASHSHSLTVPGTHPIPTRGFASSARERALRETERETERDARRCTQKAGGQLHSLHKPGRVGCRRDGPGPAYCRCLQVGGGRAGALALHVCPSLVLFPNHKNPLVKYPDVSPLCPRIDTLSSSTRRRGPLTERNRSDDASVLSAGFRRVRLLSRPMHDASSV